MNVLIFKKSFEINLKKRKRPALTKIYTYPIDKNVKWYKPFPEFPNADQDKYFFKYEYINAINRRISNLQQELQMEQLREVIDNDIELNEMKLEDRKLQQLNNYFKLSLFSGVMNQVKEGYLKAQAQELEKNNTAVLDAEKQRARIEEQDRKKLTLETENADIRLELKSIDDSISSVVDELLEEENLDELEEVKDILTEFSERSKYPDEYAEDIADFDNETLAEIGSLQESELSEVLDKISEATGEEVEAETEEQRYLNDLMEQKREEREKLFKAQEKAEERKIKVNDIGSKIGIQKNINQGYANELMKIRKAFMKYDNGLKKVVETRKDILDMVKTANDLRLLDNNEYDIIKNNFPNMIKTTKEEKINIRKNSNEFFKSLREGQKVNIKTFMENIRIPDLMTGLEKQNFNPQFKQKAISKLRNEILSYNKKEKLSGLGIKDRTAVLSLGERLQKQAEAILKTDLIGILEKQLPSKEMLKRFKEAEEFEEFEEEGGAT